MFPIKNATEELQKKMLKALGEITAVLTERRTDMTAMKDILRTDDNSNGATDNNKQPRIMDLKGILTKFLPGFKSTLIR